MLGYVAAGLLIVAAAPSGGSAQEGVVWKWLPEPGTCGLRQELDGQSALIISRTPGNDQTAITLQDRDAKVAGWRPFNSATVSLEPGSTIVADGFIGPGDHPRSRFVTIQVSGQEFLDRLAGASALTLSHEKFGDLRASVRSAAAAVQALRTCEDKTMREWGIDPIALRALKSLPIPSSPPVTWFSTFDYPRLQAIYGVGGYVRVRVDVGPDGRVQECAVLNRQPRPEFKDATCGVLRRNGRFRPAIDANGQPASAPYVVQVRFQPNS